jgi:hypothetical protein
VAEAGFDEAVVKVEGAGEAGFGLEAHVDGGDFDGDDLLALGGGDAGGGDAAFALEGGDLAAPEHGDAGGAELGEVEEALARQAGVAGEHGRDGTEGARVRAGRGFDDGGDLHAAFDQLAGKLQVERAVAGDEHAAGG